MTSRERIDLALERAAEMVAVCEPMYMVGFPQGDEAVTQVMPNALEGWAEAIRALQPTRCELLCGGVYVGSERCGRCEAVAKFCDTMLGAEACD